MDASAHKKNIEHKFLEYEALQQQHLELLKQEELTEMKSLVEERKAASAHLQNALKSFMDNAGSLGGGKSIPQLSEYETRLNDIMTLDERIAAEIERHRAWLKKQLGQMKQGKKAMQGYQSAGQPPKTQPRVFSVSR